MSRITITFLGEAMVELTSTSTSTLEWTFAGDVLNAAAACAAAAGSAEVRLLTGLGDDDLSDQLVERCRELGVDATRSISIADRTLGLYWITQVDGERRFRYWRATSACREALESGRLLTAAIETTHLAWSGITLAVAGHGADRLLAAIGESRAEGATICFDVNYRHALWTDTTMAARMIGTALTAADVVVASTDDITTLWSDDPTTFAERALRAGAREVIVTDGGGPVTHTTSAGRLVVRPEPAAVVDTAGAGDALWGTYLAHRSRGSRPETALAAAVDVARRAVEHRGALGYTGT